jgi:flavodoxin
VSPGLAWKRLALRKTTEEQMKDALVVYFSRTGYTDFIAGEIAATLGADKERVTDYAKRSGILGYWRCAREAMRETPVAIAQASVDPGDYDLVVLGTPVWAGNPSSPMRAFLAAHAGRLSRVAFFCTLGGSGAEKTFAKMATLCGQAPVATAAFRDAEIDKDAYAAKLDGFVRAISRREAA